jgi:hypothetical protein
MNESEPLLVITVSRAGVVDTKVLFRSLSEKQAGRILEERCSPIIALLSRCARGLAVHASPGLPIELPETSVNA